MSASKPDMALFIVWQEAHSQSRAEILEGPALNRVLTAAAAKGAVFAKVASMHAGPTRSNALFLLTVTIILIKASLPYERGPEHKRK